MLNRSRSDPKDYIPRSPPYLTPAGTKLYAWAFRALFFFFGGPRKAFNTCPCRNNAGRKHAGRPLVGGPGCGNCTPGKPGCLYHLGASDVDQA